MLNLRDDVNEDYELQETNDQRSHATVPPGNIRNYFSSFLGVRGMSSGLGLPGMSSALGIPGASSSLGLPGMSLSFGLPVMTSFRGNTWYVFVVCEYLVCLQPLGQPGMSSGFGTTRYIFSLWDYLICLLLGLSDISSSFGTTWYVFILWDYLVCLRPLGLPGMMMFTRLLRKTILNVNLGLSENPPYWSWWTRDRDPLLRQPPPRSSRTHLPSHTRPSEDKALNTLDLNLNINWSPNAFLSLYHLTVWSLQFVLYHLFSNGT